ncbi:hypothetical protein KSS87_008960 [Heliosperma pusillum]|nr:hypothetical protein KSS87_008960 [Heliosperma pusillum]
MKMTWKKKSGNKRITTPPSSNLPFQTLDFDNNVDNSNEPTKTLDQINPSSSHSSLAHNFLDQGNKLAQTRLRYSPFPTGLLIIPYVAPVNLDPLLDNLMLLFPFLFKDGKYREALGKWENAINLMPQKAVLHEQKAQILLEIGDAWGALKAATRAIELDPEWAEAWTTLGRAQLNFGEPDTAIESFDKALAIKPDMSESRDDRKTAIQLVKKRKQLHSSGLNPDKSRYQVGEEGESKLPGSG